MSSIPKTRSGVKEWCREAFFAGRDDGGDSVPRDKDYQEIYDGSMLVFEAWWEARSSGKRR